jgi:hypothetical protein
MSSFASTTVQNINWSTQAVGADPHDSKILYSLLSVGFFRGEFGSNFESVRNTWIAKHLQASLIPVFEYPGTERMPGSKIVVVWIADKRENLNVELVRRGCLAAEYLYAPPSVHLLVTPTQYEHFRNMVVAAEKVAKARRLGIWSKAEQKHNQIED